MGDFEQVVSGLAPEAKKILLERYGVEARSYANGIEALEPLTAAEQQVFDEKSFISPYFTVQQVYKVKGSISPVRFNLAVFNRFANTRELRSNYLALSGRFLRVVFKGRKEKPEIIYRSLGSVSGEEVDSALRNAMGAEMRRSFDIESGPLARFLVLRTAADEYAVLVTAVNLVVPFLNVRGLLGEAQDLLPAGGEPAQEAVSPQAGGQIAVSVLKYWRSVLADLPPQPVLPNFKRVEGGWFMQEAYRAVLPSEDFDRLRDKLQGDPRRMVALLQLAWGLLLQYYSNREDTYFCLLSSGSGTAMESGGQLSMIPVRLKCSAEEGIAGLLQRLDKQLSLSQPFSCLQRGGLEELLGQRHDLFNHFLSFLDFNETGGASFCRADGDSCGALVMQQAWDARGMPLGLYFRYGGDSISLTMLYNKYSLAGTAVEALADRYFLSLHVLLFCWEAQTSDFKAALAKRTESLQRKRSVSYSEEALLVCLSKLAFLRELPSSWLANLAKVAKVRTYYENDQILMGHDLGQVFFVLNGSVARSMDSGTGWFSMLDVVREGRLLNETVFLEKTKSEVIGEVLSERAEIISLPLVYAREGMLKNDAAKDKLLMHTLREMEKYQRRWVSS